MLKVLGFGVFLKKGFRVKGFKEVRVFRVFGFLGKACPVTVLSLKPPLNGRRVVRGSGLGV